MKKLIIVTLLIATVAAAQQTHNQYEPANTPGAGQKLLAQFAWNWEVVKTLSLADMTKSRVIWVRSTGL
jgi:hypothetical protein